MKKIILWLLSFGAFSSAAQTKAIAISKEADFNLARKSAVNFAGQIIDAAILDVYFDVSRQNAMQVVNENLKTFAGKNVAGGDKLGYVINIRVKPKYSNDIDGVIGFNLFVDPDYKVFFDEGWSGGSPMPIEENIAVKYRILPKDHIYMFMGAINVFVVSLSKNRVLTKEQVVALADKADPGKKWDTPKIRQNSIPDYAVYWQVIEAGCSECEKIDVEIDKEIITNTSSVKMEKM